LSKIKLNYINSKVSESPNVEVYIRKSDLDDV